MTTINPYLSFKGNCEEAFNFYKSVFGGEFQFIGRYKDLPATDRQSFSLVKDDKIMHVSLPISAQNILMGCDSSEDQPTMFGNNIVLSVTTDTKLEADRLFNGLSISLPDCLSSICCCFNFLFLPNRLSFTRIFVIQVPKFGLFLRDGNCR